MLGSMTYARSIPIPRVPLEPSIASRAVSVGRFCGEDRLTGRSFEHRRQGVEDRIYELAGIFGVAIWGYAVMSNHLHVVVQVVPQAAAAWSAVVEAKDSHFSQGSHGCPSSPVHRHP